MSEAERYDQSGLRGCSVQIRLTGPHNAVHCEPCAGVVFVGAPWGIGYGRGGGRTTKPGSKHASYRKYETHELQETRKSSADVHGMYGSSQKKVSTDKLEEAFSPRAF